MQFRKMAGLCGQLTCRLCCWCRVHIVIVAHALPRASSALLLLLCSTCHGGLQVVVQTLLPVVECSMLALSDSCRC